MGRSAALVLVGVLLTACAGVQVRQSDFATAGPAPAVRGMPRSPGNAALSLRAAMLFGTLCADLDLARAAQGAERLGFYRAGPAEAAVFLGEQAGEVWINGGCDVYALTLVTGPHAACRLGVHLAEPAQLAVPFAALLQQMRSKDYALTRTDAGRPGDATQAWRAVGPDGRTNWFGLAVQVNPGIRIRSALVAQAGPL